MKEDKQIFPYLSFDDRYSFASGVIRGLETRLLDQRKINKLIITRDIEHFMGELSDSIYRPYVDKFEKSMDFEDLLFDVYKDLIRDLLLIAPDKKIGNFFYLFFDTYNIKMALKHIYYHKPYEERLLPFGSIPEEALKGENINLDLIPEQYKVIFEKYKEIEERSKGELYINDLVDNFYYNSIYKETLQSKSKYLLYLHKHNIELINAATLLRKKIFDFKKIELLEHGFTSIEELIKLSEKSFEDIVKYFTVSGYGNLFDMRIKEHSEILKNFLIRKYTFINDIYSMSNYITMGIEVLVIYFFKKKEEMSMLRKIFLAKLRNIDSQTILRLL